MSYHQPYSLDAVFNERPRPIKELMAMPFDELAESIERRALAAFSTSMVNKSAFNFISNTFKSMESIMQDFGEPKKQIAGDSYARGNRYLEPPLRRSTTGKLIERPSKAAEERSDGNRILNKANASSSHVFLDPLGSLSNSSMIGKEKLGQIGKVVGDRDSIKINNMRKYRNVYDKCSTHRTATAGGVSDRMHNTNNRIAGEDRWRSGEEPRVRTRISPNEDVDWGDTVVRGRTQTEDAPTTHEHYDGRPTTAHGRRYRG